MDFSTLWSCIRHCICSPEELTGVISRIITDSSIDITQQSHIMFACDTRLVLVIFNHMIMSECSHDCSCDCISLLT